MVLNSSHLVPTPASSAVTHREKQVNRFLASSLGSDQTFAYSASFEYTSLGFPDERVHVDKRPDLDPLSLDEIRINSIDVETTSIYYDENSGGGYLPQTVQSHVL